jgi:hypothetical protein
VLHRVVQSCGLEDCAQLLALATPDDRAIFSAQPFW